MLAMIDLNVNTSPDICKRISGNMRSLRRASGLTQAALSEKAGVSLGSLKRFETTGQISLASLANLAIALGVESEMLDLFSAPHYSSIEEVIRENS